MIKLVVLDFVFVFLLGKWLVWVTLLGFSVTCVYIGGGPSPFSWYLIHPHSDYTPEFSAHKLILPGKIQLLIFFEFICRTMPFL